MQYKICSPKYVYYLGCAVYLISVLFLALIYRQSMSSDEISARIILGVISTGLFLWLLFYTKKFVHAKIDLTNRILLFGNIFFNQIVSLDEVKVVGRFLYFKRIVRIEIDGKTYYINSVERGIEQLFSSR